MGIKDVFNQAPSIEEEALYKQVLDEVESGVMRKGIYAKALADGLGNEGKAQALYIKYRVQSLVEEQKDKAKLLGIQLAEKEKEREREEQRINESIEISLNKSRKAYAEQKKYQRNAGDRPIYVVGFIVLFGAIITFFWL